MIGTLLILHLIVLFTASAMASSVALKTVRLSAGKSGPLCVLVHGLDSFSGTWKSTMESMSTPSLAVDQRGCGKTEWGGDFSQDALVDDLYEIIKQEPEPVVLVGHSLGGRVAMGYAAKYPHTLCAVVIEDMDIYPRPLSMSPIPISEDFTGDLFERQADSLDELKAAFEKYSYPKERVDEWLVKGRIVMEDDGSYWSNANPDFRRLCYQHLISQPNARRDCRTIADKTPQLPCHVMVAGKEGTICLEESIDEMKMILDNQLTVHRYPNAGHSIHSTEHAKFCSTMEDIIQKVSRE